MLSKGKRPVVSQGIWNSYQFNLGRARALIDAQGYLERLGENDEGGLAGAYADTIAPIFRLVGLDFGKLMEVAEAATQSAMETELERQMSLVDRAELVGRAAELEADPQKIMKLVRPFFEPMANLAFLSDGTLIEAGVVLAVSSYEAMLRDVVHAEARRRPSILERFPDVEKRLDHKALRRFGRDARLAGAELLSKSLDAHKPDQVRSYMKRIYGIQNVFPSSAVRADIVRATCVRNLLVHRAGLVDREFKSLTQWRQPVGKRVVLTDAATRRWIRAFYAFGRSFVASTGRPWAASLPEALVIHPDFAETGHTAAGASAE